MFVLILAGCNKFTPEVLDVVDDEKLLSEVTKWNGGACPSVLNDDFQSTEFKEDPDLFLFQFLVPNITYKRKELIGCCSDPIVYAFRKVDTNIVEMMSEVQDRIC